ncbi:MAG: acyl-CoA dehydrogenase family protein [Acidimicrobiia bacterium]
MIDVEEFRLQARAWLADNMPRLDNGADPYDAMPEHEAVLHAKRLQRLLADGGYAGIVFPKEYGGQGLTPEHNRAWTAESKEYQSPHRYNMSTVAIVAPALLEFGTEEQKRRWIPRILNGDHFWAQMLSEPSGGSNLAGALTRATKDGDTWVLNGSKVWTTGGHLRDMGFCLARTDWDVPKHKGLSFFVVDLKAPGVTIQTITQSNGNAEFCEEFFDDVVLPADALVGDPGQGWAIAQRVLFFERSAVGGSTIYAGRITGRRTGGGGGTRRQRNLVNLTRSLGTNENPDARRHVAEAHVLTTVRTHLIGRINAGSRAGTLNPQTAAVLKLFTAETSARIATISAELAGPEAVVGDDPSLNAFAFGPEYLVRQSRCIAGGSSEIQRNNISERVLGMPRERTDDSDRPFSGVQRGT